MFASPLAPSIPLPVASYLFTPSSFDEVSGYATLDGDYVSQAEGEEALRTGMAVLVGGFLVGLG